MPLIDILNGISGAANAHNTNLFNMAEEQKKELGVQYSKIVEDPNTPPEVQQEAANRMIGLHTLAPGKKIPKEWTEFSFVVQPKAPPQQQPQIPSMDFGANGQAPEAPAPTAPQTFNMGMKIPYGQMTGMMAERQKALSDAAYHPPADNSMSETELQMIAANPADPRSAQATIALKGIREQKIAEQKAAATPQPPSKVGEYNFYADQETKAGRTPLSYNEWIKQATSDSTSVEAKELAAFLKKYPDKDEWDFAAEKAKLAPTASFNVNNPAASPEDVNYLADQIDEDPTGTMFTKLTAGNKKLQAQVRAELSRRDSDLRILTASTRQLGETAHELMPKFDQAIALVNDPEIKKAMGVIGSRWQEFLTGRIGTSDPAWRGMTPQGVTKMNALRSFVSLLQTGTARAHVGARGSAALQTKFENLFNSTKMDAGTLNDTMAATKDFLTTYESAVFGKSGSAAKTTIKVINGKKYEVGEDGTVLRAVDN